jgi:ribosomal protein L37AE/L43A
MAYRKVKDIKDSFGYKNEELLSSEWNYELNNFSPFEVYNKSNIKANWICKNNHKYITKISNRAEGHGCPYCSKTNARVLFGFNDVYTLRPDLRKYFVNIEDAKNNVCSSLNMVKVECPNCKERYNKSIKRFTERHFVCSKCGDGYSYPNKFMYNLLSQLDINFDSEKIFNWSQGKIYDFYIEEISCIIEMDGKQHKIDNCFNKKLLKQEQENDSFKEYIAKENGIKNFIRIDCQKSEFLYIKEQILKDKKINELFDLSKVDWIEINEFAIDNLKMKQIKEICSLYKCTETEYFSSVDIKNKTGYSMNRIQNALKLGNEIKLCSYSERDYLKWISKKAKESNKTKLKVLFIEENISFDSLRDCQRYLENKYNKDFHSSRISNVCKGKIENYKGFHFKYL